MSWINYSQSTIKFSNFTEITSPHYLAKSLSSCFWQIEMEQSVIDKAIDQWWPRLRACVHASGQHFEQLINWNNCLSVERFCFYKRTFFHANFEFKGKHSQGSVREIFAIKVESCLKSRRILASQILGGGPSPKVVSSWTPLNRCTSRGKVSWRYSHYPQSYSR